MTDPGPTERPFRRLSPLTPVVRGAIFFVAVVAASWQELARGELGLLSLFLLAALVVGAGYGAASWALTKYRIEGDELRVDTGVIARQSRRIRVDRLQGIDIAQPFLARVFGLAELRMDVAGAGKSEGSLAFMSLAEAQQLREQLLARRDRARQEITWETPVEELPPPQPEVVLARLELDLLLASLVLSTETLAMLVTGAGLVAAALTFGAVGAVTGLIPVVAGFGLVLVRKLTGFYNFTVSDTATGLQVRRGLFSLTSQTIALHRVQGVVISEPLLWRPFGWARLDVSVAGYGGLDDDDGQMSSTVLPVGPRRTVLLLAQHVLRGLDPDAVPLVAPPRRAGWIEPIGRHFTASGLDGLLLVSRHGWFQRRTHAVPHRRVQSLRLHQGPLQRRLRLADVYVDSPPGPVRVLLRLRDAAEGRPLLEQAAELARQARRSEEATPTSETIQ